MDKNKETKGQNSLNKAETKGSAVSQSKKSKTAFSVSNFLAGGKSNTKAPAAKVEPAKPATKIEQKQQPEQPAAKPAPVKKGGLVASIYNNKRRQSVQVAPMQNRVPHGAMNPYMQGGGQPYGAYPQGQMPNPYMQGPYGQPYGYPYMPNPYMPNPYAPNAYPQGQMPNPYGQPNNVAQQPEVTQPAPAQTTKQAPQEPEPEEEYEDEEEYEEEDEQTEQERLKEQTLNYFAERVWTRKPKAQEEPEEDDGELDYERFMAQMASEAEEEEPEENKGEEAPEENDEDVLELEELEEAEEEAKELEKEVETSEEAPQEEPVVAENSEEEKEENATPEEPQEEKAENEEGEKQETKAEPTQEKQEPKVISKLDYFKYRFVDNTAVGTQGKARVEELATRFGARREEDGNAGFIASKDGNGENKDNLNEFNKEEINLDFSKKGSAKIYKNSKGLSVAAIIFALIYAIGAVVAFMMYGTPVAPEKKVVAMSLNVASTYVKYAEVGDVIDISAYTITLTNEDDTTKTIKANNSMVTSWPDCVDNATHIVISAQTDAKIRISYNSSFYKTITLTTYEYEISGVYYTGNATDLSSVMLYVEYVAKTAEGENLEINGKTLIKKQQLAVSTTPNTPGFVVTSGNDVTSVYINDTIMQYTATRV